MKRRTITIVFLMAALTLWQSTAWADPTDQKAETGVITGGGGGPAVIAATRDAGPEVYVGGRGGLLLWETVLVGGGGYIGIPSRSENGGSAGYGGIVLEFFSPPMGNVALSISSLLGGGGAEYESSTGAAVSESFLVADIGVSVNIQLARFITLSPTLRYGHTIALSGEDSWTDAVSGFGAAIHLRLGRF